jgi:hypothetical protein
MGRPCAAAEETELLFNLTPVSKGDTQASAARGYVDARSSSHRYSPVQITRFPIPRLFATLRNVSREFG